jgi:hypothetical protein
MKIKKIGSVEITEAEVLISGWYTSGNGEELRKYAIRRSIWRLIKAYFSKPSTWKDVKL